MRSKGKGTRERSETSKNVEKEKYKSNFCDIKRKHENPENKSYENSLFKTQKTDDGGRDMQGGRAGHHQGEALINKTKITPSLDAAEGKAQEQKAQPPEPLAPVEVPMLMDLDTHQGQQGEPDKSQQEEWTEVRNKKKNN